MLRCKKFVDGEGCITKRIAEKQMNIINENDLIENCNGFADKTKCCWFVPDYKEKEMVYHYVNF